jgi:hypothetical protein
VAATARRRIDMSEGQVVADTAASSAERLGERV